MRGRLCQNFASTNFGLSGLELELFSIWAPKLILMKHQGVAPPRAPGPVRPGFYPAWAGRQVGGVRYVRLLITDVQDVQRITDYDYRSWSMHDRSTRRLPWRAFFSAGSLREGNCQAPSWPAQALRGPCGVSRSSRLCWWAGMMITSRMEVAGPSENKTMLFIEPPYCFSHFIRLCRLCSTF